MQGLRPSPPASPVQGTLAGGLPSQQGRVLMPVSIADGMLQKAA